MESTVAEVDQEEGRTTGTRHGYNFEMLISGDLLVLARPLGNIPQPLKILPPVREQVKHELVGDTSGSNPNSP